MEKTVADCLIPIIGLANNMPVVNVMSTPANALYSLCRATIFEANFSGYWPCL